MYRAIQIITVFFLLVNVPSIANAEQQLATKPYHHLPNGRFRNPPGSPARDYKAIEFVKFIFRRIVNSKHPTNVPAEHVIPEAKALALLKAHQQQDFITWLGHATFLIHLNGKTIITDPFLTKTAGVWFVGPERYIAPAISINNLPPIDIILLSHNHYDHLDADTIKRLKNKDKITVIVPLKLAKLFKRYGYKHVIELDWYDSVSVDGLKITSLPAVHFSARGLFDRNKTLWSGYAIDSAKQRVYFSGDTGYGKVFKTIGERYGPFDIAILGIGAYEPRSIMKASHVQPEEAVNIAKDLRAKTLIGMHWGTIVLSDEPPFEPPKRFVQAAKKQGYKDSDIWIMRIGESKSLEDRAGLLRPATSQ